MTERDPSGPGSCLRSNPSVSSLSAGDPSRTPWQPIETAPKDTRTVLLIAAYPFSSTVWSDPRAGWWDGSAWTRWPHDFPPDFWSPITMPEPAQGIEAREGRGEDSAEGESLVTEGHAPEIATRPPTHETADEIEGGRE